MTNIFCKHIYIALSLLFFSAQVCAEYDEDLDLLAITDVNILCTDGFEKQNSESVTSINISNSVTLSIIANIENAELEERKAELDIRNALGKENVNIQTYVIKRKLVSARLRKAKLKMAIKLSLANVAILTNSKNAVLKEIESETQTFNTCQSDMLSDRDNIHKWVRTSIKNYVGEKLVSGDGDEADLVTITYNDNWIKKFEDYSLNVMDGFGPVDRVQKDPDDTINHEYLDDLESFLKVGSDVSKIQFDSSGQSFTRKEAAFDKKNKTAWKCGMAVDAGNRLHKWTRHSRYISIESIDQLNGFISLTNDVFRTIKEQCQDHIDGESKFKITFYKSCSKWRGEYLRLARACSTAESEFIRDKSKNEKLVETKHRSIANFFELEPIERINLIDFYIKLDRERSRLNRIEYRRLRNIEIPTLEKSLKQSEVNVSYSSILYNFMIVSTDKVSSFFIESVVAKVRQMASRFKTGCLFQLSSTGCSDLAVIPESWKSSRDTPKLQHARGLALQIANEIQGKHGISEKGLKLLEELTEYSDDLVSYNKYLVNEITPDLTDQQQKLMAHHKQQADLYIASSAKGMDNYKSSLFTSKTKGKAPRSFKVVSLSGSLDVTQTDQHPLIAADNNLNDDYENIINTINKNDKLSLFKIISNRYLKRIIVGKFNRRD